MYGAGDIGKNVGIIFARLPIPFEIKIRWVETKNREIYE